MVTSLMASGEFSIMVNAYAPDKRCTQLQFISQVAFMDAADYAIQAQGYFRWAILDHNEWSSVEIEIGDRNGSIQILQVTR